MKKKDLLKKTLFAASVGSCRLLEADYVMSAIEFVGEKNVKNMLMKRACICASVDIHVVVFEMRRSILAVLCAMLK